MTAVPNLQPYVPLGLQVGARLSPDDLNTNFNDIVTAFALPWTSDSSGVFSATNRIIALSAAGAGNDHIVVIALPTNPCIGDPPCRVIVTGIGTGTPRGHVIVTTADGQPIDGIAQTGVTPYFGAPNMWNVGDILMFRFVGGKIGWLSCGRLSAISLSVATAFGSMPYRNQRIVARNALAMNIRVDGLASSGSRASVYPFNTGALTIGDASATFNGVAGPYVVAPSTSENFISNIGKNQFLVTL